MIPLCGFIYHDNKFVFPDGSSKPKYLLVLCDSKDPEIILSALITSVPKSDPAQGCHPFNSYQRVFHIPAGTCFLPKPSWVCLDRVVPTEFNKLKNWDRKGELTIEMMKDILSCATQGMTIENIKMQAIKEHLAAIS